LINQEKLAKKTLTSWDLHEPWSYADADANLPLSQTVFRTHQSRMATMPKYVMQAHDFPYMISFHLFSYRSETHTHTHSKKQKSQVNKDLFRIR